MGKTSSIEEYKLIANFQSLRKSLLRNPPDGRLERPLAYWALPSDRRLPLAFLGRSIKELIDSPFDQLAATPGVGRKKMASLLKLLERTANDNAPEDSSTREFVTDGRPRPERTQKAHREFNPDGVSEAMWQTWRETIRQHNVGQEKLGHLAPSLQALPTVLWQTPVSAYLECSLSEMRQLKTHGEKRIRVVLEVFHALYHVIASVRTESHLTLRLLPKFVVAAEQWIDDCLRSTDGPSADAVRQSLTIPLLHQTEIDCGQSISRLVEGRLGIHGSPQAVRTQAKRSNLTRARVYQLLEECQLAMRVRWPDGSYRLAHLLSELEAREPPPEGLPMLRTVNNLYFADASTVPLTKT